MGASVMEEHVSLSNQLSSVYEPLRDRSTSKHIQDNVHGCIFIEPLFLDFIDSQPFQRLRDLKQLGIAHMVYPGAVHSRFEHSLGVYHLAGEAVQKLKLHHGSELGIDHFDMQTVKLAGLLHDLGHGPFSHLFEREFLHRLGIEWSHEHMSVDMIDYIVDQHYLETDPDIIKKAKEMILASSEFSMPKSMQEKEFLYDIVANGRNGIDVDKFDYIVRDCRACGLGCSFQSERLMETMRVIDNEICYRAKDYLYVHKLFATRADLHRTVYTHPKVKAVELMCVDALVAADSHLKISSQINQPASFWKLDDTILKRIEIDTSDELKDSRDLIQRIRRRDLYQYCNEFAVPRDKLEHFKAVTPQDIVCSQKSSEATLREEDVVVSNVKIDLTRGRHNPLESIKFFKDYNSNEKFGVKDECISHLLPASNQDMIVRVYAKKPDLVMSVSEAFVNFQNKMFGNTKQKNADEPNCSTWVFGTEISRRMLMNLIVPPLMSVMGIGHSLLVVSICINLSLTSSRAKLAQVAFLSSLLSHIL
ncbi:hypothetical protein NE237_021955 [Protea cynaroides]|uniref:HD domain-containing protein n=1 Tax=Protea cynaroides TaxID=273540 RepID=A0A9Q0K4V3_9MAGN|nr:hypothetical protein NE237_021955 [Protea cynaroides]